VKLEIWASFEVEITTKSSILQHVTDRYDHDEKTSVNIIKNTKTESHEDERVK
jgi:hypothetical protein